MRMILVALALALGCSESANTQHLPIGSRCASNDDCGTKPYSCNKTYPGGYCQKDCDTNGECPQDSLCAKPQCRRKCTDAQQCREREGYTCGAAGATGPVCDVTGALVDGGTPD